MRRPHQACNFAVAIALAAVSCVVNAESRPAQTEPTSRAMLIVRVGGTLPTTPEALSDESERLGASMKWRLGNPSSIRPLIGDRSSISDSELKVLTASAEETVDEQLDRYTVLEFESPQARDDAVAQLQRDVDVLFVSAVQTGAFLANPNDPLWLYSAGTHSPLDRQWALNGMSLPAAWDLVEGNAVVGIADNGIDLSHSQLTLNYRPHMSASYNGVSSSLDEKADSESFAGHGTHVAGLVAARRDSIGTTGVCARCSLMITRIASGGYFDEATVAEAITNLARRGAQVINMSFGFASSAYPANYCSLNPAHALCLALERAAQQEVVVVAAAGNNKGTQLQFPANDSRVIGVGGTQSDGGLWNQQVTLGASPARSSADLPFEIGTNSGTNLTVVAGARDILSTMYNQADWNASYRCGTAASFNAVPTQFVTQPQVGFGQTAANNFRYGICTGTSMSSAIVSGVVALIRGANPLRTVAQVRSHLTSFASNSGAPNTTWGYGVPSASQSVQAAINTNSRLTPMFVAHTPGSANIDYLYTTSPQMLTAAYKAKMWPNSANGTGIQYYSFPADGNYVPGFNYPPSGGFSPKAPYTLDNYRARARLKVFTTPKDSSGTTLIPLYRFSVTDSGQPLLLRHFIAAGDSDAATVSSNWKLDAVEGYIYPPTIPQPSGTTKVLRRVSPTTLAYVIFPEADLAAWTAAGYTGIHNIGVIGYAYTN